MRKILLFCFLASFSLRAADPREAEILDREKAFWSAWYSHDVEGISKLVADDFLAIDSAGMTFDKKRFLQEGVRNPRASMRNDPEFVDLLIRVYATNTAVVTFRRAVKDSMPDSSIGPVYYRFTNVWVNVGGKGWRIVSYHESRHPDLR